MSETPFFPHKRVNKATCPILSRAPSISMRHHRKFAGRGQQRPARLGAIVVGGGTTLNCASQITNGRNDAGVISVRRAISYTESDQGHLLHAANTCSASVGGYKRLQSNDVSSRSIRQFSFTARQHVRLSGQRKAIHLPPCNTRLFVAFVRIGPLLCRDGSNVTPHWELRVGFRCASTNGWNEADGRASNLCGLVERRD